MKAVIVNGGHGTRVEAITKKYGCKKHEIPLLDKPFCSYMYSWLNDQDVDIEYFEASTPDVGTGGVVKGWSEGRTECPFLMVYGDCFCKFNVLDAYQHLLVNDFDMVIVVKRTNDQDYGLIETNAPCVLPEMVEGYSRHHERMSSYLTNIGTYIIGRRAYTYIQNMRWRGSDDEWCVGTLSLEHDVFFPTFFNCLRVGVYDVGDAYYYDVGTPERIDSTLAQLCREYPTREV